MMPPKQNRPTPVEPELLGQVLADHGAALELYARQFCGCPEDVLQEALIDLASQRELPEQLLPWLYRVVRNKAISAARAAQRRRKHEAAQAAERWFTPRRDDALDADQVRQALETLPIEQREVVVAHLWGELTFEQIGTLIGASRSTAHRHYEAGLTALRERLQTHVP